MWSEVIYRSDNKSASNLSDKPTDDSESFIAPIAAGLYSDLKRLGNVTMLAGNLQEDFISLTNDEKSFWLDYATEIPLKLKKLNLFIRPFAGFCRTCIITDNEIATLVQMDLARYCKELVRSDLKVNKNKEIHGKAPLKQNVRRELIRDWNKLALELNNLIPYQLKKIGFEIIRHEEAVEISIPLISKLARALHAKYLYELRSQHARIKSDPLNSFFNSGIAAGNKYIPDFDDLPDEIKYSNIDNAAHIPTKLLSIGYRIRPVKKGFKPLALHLSEEEIETMSIIEHIRWSWDKRLNGWTYGQIKDEINKTHPGLIPYSWLSESEKDKDRELVKLIPALLKDIDYEVFPADIRRIRHLSYALKPQSIIHKILKETREMNDQIRKLVTLPPLIEEMVAIRNKKIEEAIREIEGSYNYAQHIQETFLPGDLYVRECFPDSFILYKPKDIVSGDFYFFSKQGHRIIFAAVDCTGHGIPGALLSTIGYGIIDQAVNEIKLTDPSSILFHLYSKIHRFLRNDYEEEGISDDMDVILCILDIRTYILTYSGVKNSLYHISKGELIEYKPNNSPDYCNTENECTFLAERIQLQPGDTIYLGSDGYADQFGGKHHKKYQSSRLKTFLRSISDLSMPEQSDMLYEEIEHWRDENHEEQTDDILIIGIRL